MQSACGQEVDVNVLKQERRLQGRSDATKDDVDIGLQIQHFWHSYFRL